MAEGLFHPTQLNLPGLKHHPLCGAMVRILPRTILVLDIVDSLAEVQERAHNESLPDGTAYWYRFFTREDLARVEDPEFAMGMVRHEFSRLVKAGVTFPASIPLDGGGSGFAIDPHGHVVTNYHLVRGEVDGHQRGHGVIGEEVLCRGLKAQIAQQDKIGRWSWQDAREVWLVSNPPENRAIIAAASGVGELREDTALLRVVPAPPHFLEFSRSPAAPEQKVWMAGFPLRTARSPQALASVGYTDADGSLRISTGQVLSVEGADYFTADLDGSMGNSGSPVLNEEGLVVGMFSRMAGNGPKNAFEYGHTYRIQLSAELIVKGMHLPPGELPTVEGQ